MPDSPMPPSAPTKSPSIMRALARLTRACGRPGLFRCLWAWCHRQRRAYGSCSRADGSCGNGSGYLDGDAHRCSDCCSDFHAYGNSFAHSDPDTYAHDCSHNDTHAHSHKRSRQPRPRTPPRLNLQPRPIPTPTPIPEGTVLAVMGGETFILELALTPAERSRGLSNREHLAPVGGMLFVFARESNRSFWMKETLIPLDILFLDEERRIVNIHTMHPQPGVPDGQLTLYRSTAPAQYAVEVNAGIAAELELAPGMVVEFTLPSP